MTSLPPDAASIVAYAEGVTLHAALLAEARTTVAAVLTDPAATAETLIAVVEGHGGGGSAV